MSENSNIKVSVLVTVYGVEAYIGAFAQSLFSQTWKDIEFVIVNDGTRDRSMDILRETLAAFPEELRQRVKIVDSDNRGVAKARMLALSHATGDYIIYADADDRLAPQMIEKLALAAPGHDFVYCDFFKDTPEGEIPYAAKDYTAADKTRWMDDVFRWHSYSFLWDAMFSADLIRTPLIDPPFNMNEDTFLYFQLLQRAQSIVHVKEPLYYYRIRKDSLSQDRKRRWLNYRESARNMLEMRKICLENNYEILSPHTSDYLAVYYGWKAFRYDRQLFKDYPDLGPTIRKTKIKDFPRIPKAKQLLVHLYLLCKNTPT